MKGNRLLLDFSLEGNSLSPNPIDKRVGSRIRFRRKLLGYSQEKLALALGLSFQQIQKYEKGLNRVGASRLYYIAQILQVPINFFFDERLSDFEKNNKLIVSPFLDSLDIKDYTHSLNNKNDHEESVKIFDSDIMNSKETVTLLKAYYHIHDEEIRRKLLHLIKVMAE